MKVVAANVYGRPSLARRRSNDAMTGCKTCLAGIAPLDLAGTLFLAPPLAHSHGSLSLALRARGIAFEEAGPKIFAIEMTPTNAEAVLATLVEALGVVERRDTKALILPRGATPTLADLMNVQPLSALLAKVQEVWLREMIRERRLTTHFQPIVRVDAPDEVFAYECLLRGRMPDGSPVAPVVMYDAARESDLLFALDRAARLTAVSEAKAHRIREHLFINFNPSSIYDPAFCLRSTIAAIDSAGIDPGRVVFEVVESDQIGVDLLGIMKTYRRAGFLVAIDDLGAGYGSLNLLSQLRPDFIKLDIKLVRDVHVDRYKDEIASKLLEMARGLGIRTIAEGIETPGELEWFRAHGADYAQGFYIARPNSPPPKPFADDPPAPEDKTVLKFDAPPPTPDKTIPSGPHAPRRAPIPRTLALE